MAQCLRPITLLALAALCCAPAPIALGASESGGWAKLAARTGPHGAIRQSFAASSARIVITARVTSLPTPARGMKIDLIRPDGRNAKTTWLHRVARGETFVVTLARAAFSSHPGKWRARFVAQKKTRSAVTFTVRAPPHPTARSSARAGCDPSYPTVCIHPPPPELNCADIPYTNFAVRPPDPQGFDGNNNGVGCES